MTLNVARAAPSEAGAPEPEIKITPEMIEAGTYEIECATGGADLGGYFSAREWAERVYRAMALAARTAHSECL